MVNYWGNMKNFYYVRFVNYEQKGINQRHTRNSCDMWLTQYYLAILTYEEKKTLPDMHTWKFGVLTSIPK